MCTAFSFLNFNLQLRIHITLAWSASLAATKVQTSELIPVGASKTTGKKNV